MKTKGIIVLAFLAGALVLVTAASAVPPIVTPGSDYTWVQPPAWIPTQGELPSPAPPGVEYPWVQPPARVPIAPKPVTPVTLPPGSSYPWVQPPASVPTGETPVRAAAVELPPSWSYPWVQPPAWIPVLPVRPEALQPPVSTGPVEPSWIPVA